MLNITLDIQDRTGRVITMTIAREVTLQQVAQEACLQFGLPQQDRHQRPVRYVLFHTRDGRFLNPELTPQGYNLQDGDLLRLYPRPFGEFFELEILSDPERGLLYPLFAKETSLGRDTSNDITIANKAISRQHGVFEWDGYFHIYTDLGSANGSWINDQPITRPTPIADGDIISLGQRVRLLYRERITSPHSEAKPATPPLGATETVGRTALVQIPRSEVFLSYSSGQRDLVEVLEHMLSKVGVKLLYDQDDPAAAMRRSEVMVAILSREAVQNAALQAEWDTYASLRKPVIPVIFEPCRMPPLMADAPVQVEYQYNDRELVRDVLEALHMVVSSSLG